MRSRWDVWERDEECGRGWGGVGWLMIGRLIWKIGKYRLDYLLEEG